MNANANSSPNFKKNLSSLNEIFCNVRFFVKIKLVLNVRGLYLINMVVSGKVLTK